MIPVTVSIQNDSGLPQKCRTQACTSTCAVKGSHRSALATKGFFGECQTTGGIPEPKRRLYADAARAAHPSLVLHRWLATPPSASAHDRTTVSAVPGSRPRHASDRRRPRHAASRRFHRVQARPPATLPKLPENQIIADDEAEQI